MLTSEIETIANRGNLASPDMNIKLILKKKVIYDFLIDVGEVTWRKRNRALYFQAGVRFYDMVDDFLKMLVIYRPGASATTPFADPPRLAYIGEDPRAVAIAEMTTELGTPSGYYIGARDVDGDNADGEMKRIYLNCPPIASETYSCVYLPYPVFRDEQEDVQMNRYIPEMLQYGLVSGLRAEVYLDRYGQGDKRYTEEQARFDAAKARAAAHHDLGTREYAVYAR